MNRIWESSDEEFVKMVNESLNIGEILFKLGLTVKGNSWGYSQVKHRMEALGLTYGDFKGKSAIKQVSKEQEIPNEELFKEQKKHARNAVRRRILRDNLLEYKCAICGISEWNGKALSLELDHINGINYDNRLENLRWLCPNCHSQTTTYGSRNQQVVEPRYEITDELRNMVIESYTRLHSMKAVARELNIVNKVVQQIIKEASLSRTNQRYVIRLDKDRNELNRFGSISETCQWLMDNNYLRTRRMKTARATFLRNCNDYYLDSYWVILDA